MAGGDAREGGHGVTGREGRWWLSGGRAIVGLKKKLPKKDLETLS